MNEQMSRSPSIRTHSSVATTNNDSNDSINSLGSFTPVYDPDGDAYKRRVKSLSPFYDPRTMKTYTLAEVLEEQRRKKRLNRYKKGPKGPKGPERPNGPNGPKLLNSRNPKKPTNSKKRNTVKGYLQRGKRSRKEKITKLRENNSLKASTNPDLDSMFRNLKV